MQFEEKKMWVVWDLNLENFYNRLLVWVEFNFFKKIIVKSSNLKRKTKAKTWIWIEFKYW